MARILTTRYIVSIKRRQRMVKPLVLVIGGAGYIGSHVNKLLNSYSFDTVVVDNLSRGSRSAVVAGEFVELDIGDSKRLNNLFEQYNFDAVMHFAALTDVGESVSHPLKYYHDNVCLTISLLQAMHNHNVNTFIFSSSAAVYGVPAGGLINEEHPCVPINPYGKSKRMIEQILEDCEKAYGLQWCALRYFNAAGGDPDGLIKNHRTSENNLIPKILKNLKNGNPSATIYGTDYPTKDGTCIRDYIHVWDLASAHAAALQNALNNRPSNIYNLGNGSGFSVKEVLETIQHVTKLPMQIHIGPRRAGDPPMLVADASKANIELGWKPSYPSLEKMISDAWKALETSQP